MKSIFMALAVVFAVGGCATNDRLEVVSLWGGFIQYDPVLSGQSSAFKLATAHCQAYGKTAVPSSEPYGFWGGYANQNFNCLPWEYPPDPPAYGALGTPRLNPPLIDAPGHM